MTYPGGEVVSYTYDTHMLLDTLSGTAGYVSETDYDSAGRVTSRSLDNGLTSTYTYCPWIANTRCLAADHQLGRLQNVLTGTLQDLNYTYDAVGVLVQAARLLKRTAGVASSMPQLRMKPSHSPSAQARVDSIFSP